MWPVAPKTSHTLGVGGLESDGGSVEDGRRSFELEAEVGDTGLAISSVGLHHVRVRRRLGEVGDACGQGKRWRGRHSQLPIYAVHN